MTRKLNLMLHCGANPVSREAVLLTPTPAATHSHVPVPHGAMVNETLRHFEQNGYNVVQEAHGLTHDANRYFGMFQVVNGDGSDQMGLVFGVRNAHDKSFSAGWAFGNGVFVCDNLCFSGLVNMKRRHTRYILRDLPRIVAVAMNRLTAARKQEERRIEVYQNTDLCDREVHDLVIQGLDKGAIPATKIPHVLQQWRTPAHPEFKDRNVWSLQNAFTEVYKGSQPNTIVKRSEALHGILDTHCKVAV